MDLIKLALDWTANTNHIGFFVAREKGFYKESGLEVEIEDPSADNYQLTPAKKVELGRADFALCPTESIISYRTKSRPFPLLAVAAILQEDLSAIVLKKDSGISSPKELDGKTYASYKARYEDEIVKQMIRNDGGEGNLKIHYPDKLGIWETILNGAYDSTWIFLNWEGVQAEAREEELRYFNMRDYDVPYSYSPVLAADEDKLKANEDAYRRFLKASKKGYLYCQGHVEEAVSILSAWVPESDKNIDLTRSLALTAPHFGDESSWGKMDEKVVGEFLEWIRSKGMLTQQLGLGAVITDQLLPD